MADTTFLPLLHGLKAPPQSDVWRLAWKKFAELYGERIQRWAYQQGLRFRLPPADAEEAAEEIRQLMLAEIHSKMSSYDPARRVKGGFRRWLRQVTNHTLAGYLNRRQKGRGTGDDDVWQALLNAEVRDELDRVVTRELEQDLLLEARSQWWPALSDRERTVCLDLGLGDARGQRSVADSGVPGQTKGAELAQRLGVTTAAVYKIKQRAMTKLKDLVARLRTDYDLDEDVA